MDAREGTLILGIERKEKAIIEEKEEDTLIEN